MKEAEREMKVLLSIFRLMGFGGCLLVCSCVGLPIERTSMLHEKQWDSLEIYLNGFDEEFSEDWRSLSDCEPSVEARQKFVNEWGISVSRCHISLLGMLHDLERLVEYSVFEKGMSEEQADQFKERYIRPIVHRVVLKENDHDLGTQERLYLATGLIWKFYPFIEDQNLIEKTKNYYFQSQARNRQMIVVVCDELRVLQMTELDAFCLGDWLERKEATRIVFIDLLGKQEILTKIRENTDDLKQEVEFTSLLFRLEELMTSYFVSDELLRSLKRN